MQSEYISACDSRRAYISGFTGSAGAAIITMKEAALWTDGRYFLQAEHQLDPKAWILMKSGLPGTPQKEEWIMEKLKAPNSTLGFDPTLVPFDLIQKWKGYWSAQNAPIEICPIDQNLVDLAWSCRPARPCNAVSELALSFCGKSFEDKLKDLRSKIEAEKCAGLLVSSLDEIAWILNWRGSDIDFNPVFYSYLWIAKDCVYLYIDARVSFSPTTIPTRMEQSTVLPKT